MAFFGDCRVLGFFWALHFGLLLSGFHKGDVGFVRVLFAQDSSLQYSIQYSITGLGLDNMAWR